MLYPPTLIIITLWGLKRLSSNFEFWFFTLPTRKWWWHGNRAGLASHLVSSPDPWPPIPLSPHCQLPSFSVCIHSDVPVLMSKCQLTPSNQLSQEETHVGLQVSSEPSGRGVWNSRVLGVFIMDSLISREGRAKGRPKWDPLQLRPRAGAHSAWALEQHRLSDSSSVKHSQFLLRLFFLLNSSTTWYLTISCLKSKPRERLEGCTPFMSAEESAPESVVHWKARKRPAEILGAGPCLLWTPHLFANGNFVLLNTGLVFFKM